MKRSDDGPRCRLDGVAGEVGYPCARLYDGGLTVRNVLFLGAEELRNKAAGGGRHGRRSEATSLQCRINLKFGVEDRVTPIFSDTC